LDFFCGFLEGFKIKIKHPAGEALKLLGHRFLDRLCIHVIGVNFKLKFSINRCDACSYVYAHSEFPFVVCVVVLALSIAAPKV